MVGGASLRAEDIASGLGMVERLQKANPKPNPSPNHPNPNLNPNPNPNPNPNHNP